MMALNSESQTHRPGTGYINQSGQLIIVLPEDSSPRGFRERLLPVMLRPNEELIGRDGRLLVKATEYENYVYYFVDLNGELAFGGRCFFDAKHFSEGLAAVQCPTQMQNSEGENYLLYGYIDHSGYEVVKPQFRDAESFSEGLAAVQLAAEDFSRCYWGYIDRKGEMVIPAQFSSAKSFSAGLAVVSVNHKYGYIDHSGKLVIEPQFDVAEDFIHGREVAAVGVGGYWGCIDRTGKFVIEPRLDQIEDHNGNSKTLVLVRMGATFVGERMIGGDYNYHYVEFEGGQFTFMNASGKLIIPPVNYPDMSDYFPYANLDGTVFIKLNGKRGCLDANGNYIIPPTFDELGVSNNGFITFKQDELWGVFNHQGEIVIPAKFDGIGIFYEGLAAACQNGYWGFIDLSGELIISPAFEKVNNFSEGLAGVQFNGRWGYVDRSGQIVIPCQFEWVEEFNTGLAMVCNMDEKSSFINRSGEWLVPPGEFDGCSEFENGAAQVYFK